MTSNHRKQRRSFSFERDYTSQHKSNLVQLRHWELNATYLTVELSEVSKTFERLFVYEGVVLIFNGFVQSEFLYNAKRFGLMSNQSEKFPLLIDVMCSFHFF